MAQRLGKPCVVKTEVHTGGRGKAGGVRLVATPREAGHAGASITWPAALASPKIKALADAGAVIAPTSADIGTTVRRMLRGE